MATGAGLVALILAFGPVSGAHFNPAVTLADAAVGGLRWRDVPPYLAAQVAGAFTGVAVAHVMFERALFSASTHVRSGPAQAFSEAIATFGLLAVIRGVSRRRSEAVPLAVGAYITAASWFTASTSFANPAVTLARAVSDTFAGIRPARRAGLRPRAAGGRRGCDGALPVAGARAAGARLRRVVPHEAPAAPFVGPEGAIVDRAVPAQERA